MIHLAIDCGAALEKAIRVLHTQKKWSVDVDVRDGEVISLLIWDEAHCFDLKTRIIPPEAIRNFFESRIIVKKVINAKYFYKMMKQGFAIDTESLACASLASQLTGIEFTRLPPDLHEQVEAAGQRAIWQLENAVLPAICDMELGGAVLDADLWKAAARVQEDRAAGAKTMLDAVAREYFEVNDQGGVQINYQSTGQVLRLFRHLRLKVPVVGWDGKENWVPITTTKKEVLLPISNEPIVHALIKLRSANMLLSTFGPSYLRAVSEKTGRIHFLVDQIGTSTGRLASSILSDVNMLNIPKKGLYRAAFSGGPGYVCEAHDYNSFELRIWAELSNDPFLTEAFERGVDVHSYLAEKLFKKPVTKTVNPELRVMVKTLNFGVAFGMSPVTFYMKLRGFGIDITFKQASDIFNDHCDTLRVGINFLRDMGRTAVRQRRLTNVNGRVRTWSIGKEKMNLKGIEREGMNFPTQSTGADIIKRAMVSVRDYRKKHGIASQFFNQIYDELVTFTRQAQSDNFCEVKTQLMVEAGQTVMKHVPVVVECSTGQSWGTMSVHKPASE